MIKQALESNITVYFVRALALVLGFGTLVHVGNIAGLSDQPWNSTPPLWRVMDIVLLGFNVLVGAGLWLKRPWAIWSFLFGIIALQLVPYTVFRQHFMQATEQAAILNGLVIFWVAVLAVLFAVLLWRGSTARQDAAGRHLMERLSSNVRPPKNSSGAT